MAWRQGLSDCYVPTSKTCEGKLAVGLLTEVGQFLQFAAVLLKCISERIR
jgi:hypothetical protein